MNRKAYYRIFLTAGGALRRKERESQREGGPPTLGGESPLGQGDSLRERERWLMKRGLPGGAGGPIFFLPELTCGPECVARPLSDLTRDAFRPNTLDAFRTLRSGPE